jgi:hypothetical protein
MHGGDLPTAHDNYAVDDKASRSTEVGYDEDENHILHSLDGMVALVFRREVPSIVDSLTLKCLLVIST